MKALVILALATLAVAQTPAPKTSSEAGQQWAKMLGQKQALYMQLETDPVFLQYEKIQQDIDAMKETERQLAAAERGARMDAAAKAKAAAAPKVPK